MEPWVGVVLFNVLAVWPIARILRRVGLNPLLAGLVFVPMLGLLLVLMILGHARWPRLPPRPTPFRKPRKVVE